MQFFKSVKNIIFLMIIFLLVCALVLSGYVIYDYSNKYNKIISQLDIRNSDLDDAESEMVSYAEQIKKIQEDNETLKSEISALKGQNTELEDKNTKLEDDNLYIKKQIELLSNATGKAVNGKVCYLTFDDGPSDNTLRILDILEKYGVRATFFVVGRSKLDYIKNIKEGGHTVALHSNTHEYSLMYTSEEAYFADLNALSSKVEAITGEKCMLVRFPGGSSNQVSQQHCEGIMTRLTQLLPEMGYSYFDWNVDSCDASVALLEKDKIVQNVLNGAKTRDEICVLMHDTASKTTTVEALPEIIEGLWSMGFHFEVLSSETEQFHHGRLNN